MMQQHMQQRFDQLLGFIKDPQLKSLAAENAAAAKEMLSTLLHSGLLLPEEFREYNLQIETAKLVAGAEKLRRESDKSRHDRMSDENGVRAAVADDGAYRFNPMTGEHE